MPSSFSFLGLIASHHRYAVNIHKRVEVFFLSSLRVGVSPLGCPRKLGKKVRITRLFHPNLPHLQVGEITH